MSVDYEKVFKELVDRMKNELQMTIEDNKQIMLNGWPVNEYDAGVNRGIIITLQMVLEHAYALEKGDFNFDEVNK